MFSAASCAALSPASCAVASLEDGVGDAAAMAAKTDAPGENVERAAVAPTTPPNTRSAAITEPKRMSRVLCIPA